ncbi:hypothetical protein DJ60_3493 [Yersinia enterocolitica]|nr:hypothetical protein CH47_138 [Yersinia enterocolitica]VTP82631.1 Uncharacterised protein [Yersinia enterocolitica subsp. enterocolitica]KGA70803.1 hypothetical protein DJ59_1834 [Yersinia enterocolitica]KGA76737.1 hypothetical protein DJ60_3493 [Yersinia enterocolitica]CFQ18821.1 Uncharacterised protein [Yersinia enterocolitica]
MHLLKDRQGGLRLLTNPTFLWGSVLLATEGRVRDIFFLPVCQMFQ